MDMMMGNDGDNESLPKSPWLLMTDWNGMYDGNKRLITNLSSEAGEVPDLLGKRIRSSCQEWLLLTSTTTPGCCLLNLFSKETIQLPSIYFSYDFCILSSPPTDPACRIVFFNKERNRLMVCQPDDGKYAQHLWNYDRFPCGRYTTVAGKVYLWCGTTLGCLVSLEFEGSTYRLSVMKMNFVSPIKSKYAAYIVECSGEIFLCYKRTHQALRNDVTVFQIFKADLPNRQWVEVTSIGAYTFFLSEYGMCCSIVEPDSTTVKPNSIYFFNINVPILYAYDLGKGVIHMYPTFYNAMLLDCRFDWIMMPHNWSFGKILKRNNERGWHKKRTPVRMIKEGLDRKCHKKRTLEGIIKEEGLDSVWSSLPLDILSLIGSYLFAGDYVRFLAVCKSWQLLAARCRVPPSLAQESCTPLLMFQENPSAHTIPVYRFLDPVKGVSYCIEIPVLRNAEIRHSSEGWLLVSRRPARRPGRLFFLNPLTQQRIEFPRSPQFYDSDSFILSFSSSPTCSNCLVVALHKNGRWMSTIKHGEDSWSRRNLEYGPLTQFHFISSPVVVDNGFHYYLSVDRDLLMVNVQDDFHYGACVARPREQRRVYGSLEEDFLVEIDGGPALVTVPFAEGKVRIFQWNKGWKKMNNVDFGDKEMFLSQKSWLLEKIDGGGMGKTIFFPLIDDEDGGKNGVFYSFATHRYHSFYNGYSCTGPYFVGKPAGGGVWVKPVRTILDEPNLKWC